MNARILMSFGPDVECGTACVAGVVVEFCEGEAVYVPAAVMLCGTETFGVPGGVPATFCEVETASVSSSWTDMILVTKYNVHANRLDYCFGTTTFNHQQP